MQKTEDAEKVFQEVLLAAAHDLKMSVARKKKTSWMLSPFLECLTMSVEHNLSVASDNWFLYHQFLSKDAGNAWDRKSVV